MGGDFNCQLNWGVRGIAVQSLADAFGLQVTNNADTDWENQWTFRNTMGIKRRIDFIIASRSLVASESKATVEIDLGSDHRAVRTCFGLGAVRYWPQTHTPKMKGWRACLDEEGNPS